MHFILFASYLADRKPADARVEQRESVTHALDCAAHRMASGLMLSLQPDEISISLSSYEALSDRMRG